MSKITTRDALDSPLLARVVPRLAPETLHQLIRSRGLDACGELLTSATPAQLMSLLELDLWRPSQPGRDERFDVDRFGEWLEVLVDTSSSVAALIIAGLEHDLVVAGLAGYVRVLDPGIFEPTAQSDDESTDRHEAMREADYGDGLECELGGYIVRGRRPDAWDAIVALLTTLEDEHTDYFHVVMQGCRRLSNSRPEFDGLDDLLRAPEQHLHDVTIEREHRRSQQGYATPGDARAFLEMAREKRSPPEESTTRSAQTNPIVAAYFRAMDATSASSRHALAHARDTATDAEFARGRALAFLANVLIAGCSIQSRRFTPQEASDAAASICKLGCEYSSVPSDQDVVAAFEVGWSVLHHDVSLFVAEQLISILTDVDSVDRDIRRGLVALRRTLVKERDAGTPWLARDAAEVLAMLDMTAWISVLGLLDECPVLPAALTAVVEGCTSSVSQTQFAFISTAAQIGDVRIFMRKLPGLLSC